MNASTTASAYVEPVVRSVRVAATPERAFEVFSADIGRWWILTHSILASKSPQVAVTIEPRVGGRWYERGEDGSECDWGHVIAWEPPRRLVLAWQLNAQWEFDPALVTELEVRFAAQPDGTTEVTLEHRHLERYGAAAEAARAGLASEGGWSGLLEQFRALVG